MSERFRVASWSLRLNITRRLNECPMRFSLSSTFPIFNFAETGQGKLSNF
jgi:hypothetical protein